MFSLRGIIAVASLTLAGWASTGSAGCKPKATAVQCDELVERFAQLVVTERFPDASPAQVKSEQEREKSEARADDALKNCSSDVSQAEFECAMRASTSAALEKCLE